MGKGAVRYDIIICKTILNQTKMPDYLQIRCGFDVFTSFILSILKKNVLFSFLLSQIYKEISGTELLTSELIYVQ